MRTGISALLFLLCICCQAQLKLCSWNLQNFGSSKPDSVIELIAETTRHFDIIALVEVVAGPGGPQAVARLHDALNRKSSKWEYVLSQPTLGKSGSSERYAFLWKTAVVKKTGQPSLEKTYENEIEREPYYCHFVHAQDTITVFVFHAVPKSKQPETEIKYFKNMVSAYQNKMAVICGDFNCAESNTVFNPLKNMNYLPALTCQKTTLKSKRVNNECLASEYDNIFYPSKKIRLVRAGIISFHTRYTDLKAARRISDHLPVFMEFEIKTKKQRSD